MKTVARGRRAVGIEAQHILRAQLRDDRGEGAIEFGPERGEEGAAAGPFGHEGQDVLTADVAAGVVGNRHDHHRIDGGIGQLGGFERLVGSGLGVGVVAVGDDDNDFAACALFERPRAEEDGVEERRRALRNQVVEALFERQVVVREVAELRDVGIDAVEGHGVAGAAFGEERAQKPAGRIGFVLQILAGGAAGIDHQDDGNRLVGLALKHGQILADAVIEDIEILFVEGPDQIAGLVPDGGHHVHQIDVGVEYGRLLGHGQDGRQAEQGKSPARGFTAHRGPPLLRTRPRHLRSTPSSRWGPPA